MNTEKYKTKPTTFVSAESDVLTQLSGLFEKEEYAMMQLDEKDLLSDAIAELRTLEAKKINLSRKVRQNEEIYSKCPSPGM